MTIALYLIFIIFRKCLYYSTAVDNHCGCAMGTGWLDVRGRRLSDGPAGGGAQRSSLYFRLWSGGIWGTFAYFYFLIFLASPKHPTCGRPTGQYRLGE